MSDGELPVEWTETEFSTAAGNGQYGWTTKSTDTGTVKYLRTTDITKGIINWATVPYCEQLPEKLDNYELSIGDIVISRAGSVGFSKLIETIPGSTIFASYLIRFLPNQLLVHPKYVYHFLNSPDYWSQIAAASAGIALANVNASKLSDMRFPLAPLPEQKRIADKLDTLLAQLDSCKTHLDRIPAILKRFRQSVLAAATTGRLTEDWREAHPNANALSELLLWTELRKKSEKKPLVIPNLSHWHTEIPDNWQVCSVNQFAECLDRKRIPIKRELRKNSLGTYPYFGANGEVGKIDQYIFDDEIVLVTEDETFYGREKPIAYRSSGKCWVNNHAHVLRAPTKAANDFLCFSLMYYDVIPWLTGTTGRAKLTQLALNELPIACPPNAEIAEIVRRVESLFALADQLEARYQNAMAKVNKLAPALLAKAFRGELVPQDPADEPASVLLERIRAERAAQPSGKAGRGRKAATLPSYTGLLVAETPANYGTDTARKRGRPKKQG